MGGLSYHEELSKLSPKTQDIHRAYSSLQEELEAIDWYNQRVDAASDRDLVAILAHNRDDEKEHAAMLIEWIRRNDDAFSDNLEQFLFKDGQEITELAD